MKKTIIFLGLLGIITLIFFISPTDNYTNNGEMIIGTYDITNGDYDNLSKTKFTEDNEDQLKLISEYVKDILPKDNFLMLDSLVMMSDGQGNNLAYVYQKGNKWVLSIDYADALDSKDNLDSKFISTLSHEITHLITLNEDQMDNNSSDDTYETSEGKLKKDSYLNQFYELFWKDKVLNINESMGDAERIRYFEEHMNMYINDYATTSPEEDISESFATFVIYEKPRGNEIYKKKILFFYDYPELVNIRSEIRKNSGI
ncbi:MAG TPA: hypothetical protein VJ916_01535 [Anaerovoracaceae bacterium]|nr:hypothetical protein [Anaerovoracaceae bacterium]